MQNISAAFSANRKSWCGLLQILDADSAILVEDAPTVEGFPAVRWYGGHGGHRVRPT